MIPNRRWESQATPNALTQQNRLTLVVEIWRNLLDISLLSAFTTDKTTQKMAPGCQTCGIIGKSGHSLVAKCAYWGTGCAEKKATEQEEKKRMMGQVLTRTVSKQNLRECVVLRGVERRRQPPLDTTFRYEWNPYNP